VLGFLRRIIVFCETFHPEEIAFTWDSKDSIRKEVYPIYKENRRKVYDEMTAAEKEEKALSRAQFNKIRTWVLPALGFNNVFIQDGYEADDIIAAIVFGMPEEDSSVIITADKDMYQLLGENCVIYNPSAKAIHNVASFESEWGISPTDWGAAKSISGCKTDNVLGASYITETGKLMRAGEKTAIKYLNGDLGENTKAYAAIEEVLNDGTAENVSCLVVLPLDGTDTPVLQDSNLSESSFRHVCSTYGLKTLTSDVTIQKWLNLLSGEEK